MPASSAARTQACAASSSTWLPCVSQLPYAISEMVRPERPRRLYSTRPDARPGRRERCGRSGVLLRGGVGLGEPPAADHGRPADAVPDVPTARGPREPLGDGLADLPGEDERVDDDQQE